ncbi:MAG: hypothetical protein ACXWBP_11495 [Limisphaerales bacterium]
MTEINAPFTDVDVLYGPRESLNDVAHRWFQFTIRNNTNVLCSVRILKADSRTSNIARYQVSIGTEALDYRDAITSRALLPGWGNFEGYFLPEPTHATTWMDGIPRTCTLLGQLLSLQSNGSTGNWQQWTNAKILHLNREVLVGTGRNFKDAEGHRLPQTPEKHEYTYVEFKADDYRTMIDSGINLFWIAPHQEQFVRNEPVFYLREPNGNPALKFPADLYRANYLGYTMFVDEPAVLTIFDPKVRSATHSYDALASLVETRTHATYFSSHPYGECYLELMFKNMGVNFGDMQLLQPDFPIWETRLEFGFYELRGGGAGIVHEARYNVEGFNKTLKDATGRNWNFSADDLFKIHFAVLRGAATPFNKFWGTAIYGQCDPLLSPAALTTAYDMGARYFWFWTSDHDHHLPWNEQLTLARTVKEYAAKHPRQSIYLPQPKRDVAIALPEGLIFPFDKFDWVEAPTSQMKAAQFGDLQRVRLQTLETIKQCLQRHQQFDITIDDGRRIDGYRHVVRIR